MSIDFNRFHSVADLVDLVVFMDFVDFVDFTVWAVFMDLACSDNCNSKIHKH